MRKYRKCKHWKRPDFYTFMKMRFSSKVDEEFICSECCVKFSENKITNRISRVSIILLIVVLLQPVKDFLVANNVNIVIIFIIILAISPFVGALSESIHWLYAQYDEINLK